MKTLKKLIEEWVEDLSNSPDYFKKPYKYAMGGTQTVVIEGVGSFYFDDREYYTGRGAKYNKSIRHDNIGVVEVTRDEILRIAKNMAKSAFRAEKENAAYRREERRRYKEAELLIGSENLEAAIKLVKSQRGKTYYFVGNVMLFKGCDSKNVSVEVITDEQRARFDWDNWYSAPYAAALGMTPDDKNLFIC